MFREDLNQLLRDEVAEREEEGYDLSAVKERLLGSEVRTEEELKELFDMLDECPFRPDFQYREPSTLAEIVAERGGEVEGDRAELSDEQLFDKIYGGWLGRCAGCLLGKPVEGLSREQIEKWLRLAGEYPLKDYFPRPEGFPENISPSLRNRVAFIDDMFRKTGVGILRGQISCMARDDDIDYTIVNLHVLETYGLRFTSMNVGETWLQLLPYLQVYTAERVAYRNLVNGLKPPATATYLNPYREWIGAQIRADMWGYVAFGNPGLAAEFAYRDASLSHVKNGIYGEMFASAMISAAFASDDVEEVVQAGLSVIPERSRLAEAIKSVVGWSKRHSDWRDTLTKIYENYGRYHFVHTINNAALVVMGLLYGGGDFEESITISVMGGWDTDCNGATVGSILGVMLGAKNLPEKWVRPLNDRLRSSVVGYDNSRISELARRTFKIAKNLLEK